MHKYPMTPFLRIFNNKRGDFFSAFIVLLLAFIILSPSLQNKFVNWDDDVHLYNNPFIRSLELEKVTSLFKMRVSEVYIPLTTLFFAVEYHFGGGHPGIYHLDNLLLHLFNLVLIYILARFLGLSRLGAGAAALLFGIHPIHVESVAWITERKDVLYSFFYLSALCFYWLYLKSLPGKKSFYSGRSIILLVLVTSCGILSMLAKPMALTLPLILFLLDWFARREWGWRNFWEKAPLLLLIVGLGCLTYSAHARVPLIRFPDSFLIWSWTAVFYLRKFLLPLYSVPIYRLPQPVSILNVGYLLSLLGLAAMIISFLRFRKNRWFVLAGAYYIFSIFFLLRFDEAVDINIVADRFMYLPSLGLCFLFGYYVERLLLCPEKRFASLKFLLGIGLFFLFIVFSLRSNFQTRVWRDSVSLWSHQLHFYPQEPIALNNLATVLRDENSYREAERGYVQFSKLAQERGDVIDRERFADIVSKVDFIERLYQKAIKNDPQYVDAYYNLGNFYRDLQKWNQAIENYQKAISLDPRYQNAYLNLGRLYLEMNQFSKAVDTFEQLIRMDFRNKDLYRDVILAYHGALKATGPQSRLEQALAETFRHYAVYVNKEYRPESAFFEIGFLYSLLGDLQRARDFYLEVLSMNPNHVGALYNLANIYEELEDTDGAVSLYKKIIRLNARHPQAYMNLGVIYSQRKDYPQAKVYFERTVKLAPDDADANFNLGFIYEATGQSPQAIGAYQRAIRISPNHAEAYYNLGNVFSSLGKATEAKDAYKQAVTHNPSHINAWVNLSILAYKEGDFQGAIKYCDEAQILGYIAPQEYLKALLPYRKR